MSLPCHLWAGRLTKGAAVPKVQMQCGVCVWGMGKKAPWPNKDSGALASFKQKAAPAVTTGLVKEEEMEVARVSGDLFVGNPSRRPGAALPKILGS